MPEHEPTRPVIRYIRWWIILIYIVLIGGGVAFTFVDLDGRAKIFRIGGSRRSRPTESVNLFEAPVSGIY